MLFPAATLANPRPLTLLESRRSASQSLTADSCDTRSHPSYSSLTSHLSSIISPSSHNIRRHVILSARFLHSSSKLISSAFPDARTHTYTHASDLASHHHKPTVPLHCFTSRLQSQRCQTQRRRHILPNSHGEEATLSRSALLISLRSASSICSSGLPSACCTLAISRLKSHTSLARFPMKNSTCISRLDFASQ